jgi:hypothetical protein
MRDLIGALLLPGYGSFRARCLQVARAGLDAVTFSAAWSEGQTMTLEDAIEQVRPASERRGR